MSRSFLFLQGVCSPFFYHLARRLEAEGHRVHHVSFAAGDVLYWRGRRGFAYRRKLEYLNAFLDDKYRTLGITDQVLFGDRRPIHRVAVLRADHHGVRTHVFEEGYFRPFWVTLEREGVNGHSLLPRDPDWFREVGGRLPDYGDGEPFTSPFWIRAAHDVAYHVAGALNPILFPGFRTHVPFIAPVEYYGYVCRLPTLRFHGPRDNHVIDGLIASRRPYFLLPLQLGTDAQIRDHSRFENMSEVMEFVVDSFARNAPGDAQLVIKNHPLDMGLTDYRRIQRDLGDRFGVSDRLHYLETGDLGKLVRPAMGVVTVNSTVGGFSLGMNCPTIALSDPIYNLPGLTFQGHLDDFWRERVPPEQELFRRFRNTVIHTTQVNGGFYTQAGIRLAVENSLRILSADRSPLEALT